MRTYIWIKKWWWLLVQRARWFYDIYSWTIFKQKNIWFNTYTNPLAEVVLEFLEDNKLWYIIAWSNDESIAIYNKWSWIYMYKWTRKYMSWLYRIKKINSEHIFEFDASAIKHPYYTEFRWRDMYDLLMIAQESWFVEEKDVKKNWGFGGITVSLSQKEKMIVNHVIMYTKRLYNLITIMEPSSEDMREIQKFDEVNQLNIEMIYEWLKKNYREYIKKIKEKTIGKNNWKEVVNTFYN